jgi:hypothetical protein
MSAEDIITGLLFTGLSADFAGGFQNSLFQLYNCRKGYRVIYNVKKNKQGCFLKIKF